MSTMMAGYNDEATDWAVLMLLLDADCVPWSIEEIACEIGDHPAVTDSLKRLHRAGLVHRLEDFAFPTRSARRFEEIRS